MRKPTSRSRFLDSSRIFSFKHAEFYTGSRYYPYKPSLAARFFAYLLGHKEGGLFSFGTDNQQAERRMLQSLIDDGFVEFYREGPIFCDLPKFWSVGTRYRLPGMEDGVNFRAWGTAYLNEPRDLVYAKSMGEFLERRSSYFVNEASFKRVGATHRDFSDLYRYLPKFTSDQVLLYPHLASVPEDFLNITAIPARSLVRDKKSHVPLSCAMWGNINLLGEKLFMHPTTSGSGGGRTMDAAYLSAIYEMVERDHFLLYWFSGIKPCSIDLESIPDDFGDYVRRTQREFQVEIHFLDLRYDSGVLVCACVLVDPVLNLISLGAKAGFSAMATLKGALLEALSVMANIREGGTPLHADELEKLISKKAFTENITLIKRTEMYCSPFGISRIRSLFLEGGNVTYADYSERDRAFEKEHDELSVVIECFKTLYKTKGEGYDLLVADLTDDLAKKYRYHVVHAFVPSFLKLHLTEYMAAPISDRLVAFAREKGKELSEKNLNSLPHFFP